MRISDWSSDVCSSDLSARRASVKVDDRKIERAAVAACGGDDGRREGAVRRRDDMHRAVLRRSERHAGRKRRAARGQRQRQIVGIEYPRPIIDAGQAECGAMFPHAGAVDRPRSEEHTSELQSLMRLSYAVFCLKKKKKL